MKTESRCTSSGCAYFDAASRQGGGSDAPVSICVRKKVLFIQQNIEMYHSFTKV